MIVETSLLHPLHNIARNLMPRWHGWIAKRYGPNARYKIPYQARLAWHIEGRAFFKSLDRPFIAAARGRAMKKNRK